MPTLEMIYVMICTVGLVSGHKPEICAVYELRPQYEMTQDVINEKVDKLCVMATEATGKFGGTVTKCRQLNKDEKREFDVTASRFLPTARAF